MYYPEAEVVHYGGASSSNAPVRFYLEMQRADLRYWRKHHGHIAQITWGSILAFHQMLRVLRAAVVLAIRRKDREVYQHKLKRSLASLKCVTGMVVSPRQFEIPATLDGDGRGQKGFSKTCDV